MGSAFNISVYMDDEKIALYLKDKEKYNKVAREALNAALQMTGERGKKPKKR